MKQTTSKKCCSFLEPYIIFLVEPSLFSSKEEVVFHVILLDTIFPLKRLCF